MCPDAFGHPGTFVLLHLAYYVLGHTKSFAGILKSMSFQLQYQAWPLSGSTVSNPLLIQEDLGGTKLRPCPHQQCHIRCVCMYVCLCVCVCLTLTVLGMHCVSVVTRLTDLTLSPSSVAKAT